jgi:hypothetical protein
VKTIHLKRTLPKPGYCVLCNEKKPLTREHILAAWIGRIGIGNQIKSVESYSNSQTASEWKQEVFNVKHSDRTLPILCRICNNEFGSDLQNDVAPILKPLIDGGWKVLSESHRTKLAKWATCYQYVREFTRPDLVTTTRGERLRFRTTTEPPPGFAVWIGMAEQSTDNLPNWHRPLIFGPNNGTLQPWDMALSAVIVGHLVIFIVNATNTDFIPHNSTRRFGLMKFLYAQGLIQAWPLGPDWPPKAPSPMPDQKIGTLIPEASSALADPLPWLPFKLNR